MIIGFIGYTLEWMMRWNKMNNQKKEDLIIGFNLFVYVDIAMFIVFNAK